MVRMALVVVVTSYCIKWGARVEWSSRQALPATRGRLCFVLQLGAYGDTLGGGTRHLAIPV